MMNQKFTVVITSYGPVAASYTSVHETSTLLLSECRHLAEAVTEKMSAFLKSHCKGCTFLFNFARRSSKASASRPSFLARFNCGNNQLDTEEKPSTTFTSF